MGLRYALTAPLAAGVAAAIVASAYGYGRLALAVVRPRLPRGLAPLAAIGIGAGGLGHAAFALGVAGGLHPWALGLVVIGGLAAAAPAARTWWRTRPLERGQRLGQLALAHPAARLAVAALAASLPFALVGALLPEIEYDALWYHLTYPARYLAAGRLLDLPCEHMAPTPQQVELLYAYALGLGGARVAKLLHFAFGLLGGVTAAWLAARHLGRRWALPAAALCLVTPTVLWEMTTAYNDLPLAFQAAVAAAIVLAWRRTRDEPGARRTLVAAGLLLGVGLAGKHLAFFFLAPLGLYVLLAPGGTAPRPLGMRARDGLALVLPAIAVALPWWVRAWALTGNPLYPMFWRVLARLGLPLTRWDAQSEAGWARAMGRYGEGHSVRALLEVPWQMTWDGVRFAGSLGHAWLLLLPPALLRLRALPGAVRLLAGLALLYLLLWVSPYSSLQVRYLVPLMPLLAVVLAAGLAESLRLARTLDARLPGRPAHWLVLATVALALALATPPATPLTDARVGWVPNTIHPYDPNGLRTVAGRQSTDRYLSHWLESYHAARWAAQQLPPTARIVWFGEAAQYYMPQDVVFDYSRCVSAAVWKAAPGEEAQAWGALRAAGVTHLAWDKTTGVDASHLAIRTPAFRQYATTIYQDRVIEIVALR